MPKETARAGGTRLPQKYSTPHLDVLKLPVYPYVAVHHTQILRLVAGRSGCYTCTKRNTKTGS